MSIVQELEKVHDHLTTMRGHLVVYTLGCDAGTRDFLSDVVKKDLQESITIIEYLRSVV